MKRAPVGWRRLRKTLADCYGFYVCKRLVNNGFDYCDRPALYVRQDDGDTACSRRHLPQPKGTR